MMVTAASCWLRRAACTAAALVLLILPRAAIGEATPPATAGGAVPLSVEGMDAQALAALLAARPDTAYAYTLPLCGQQVSSEQTELVIAGEVTEAMVQELKTWLPCLPALRQVDMYDAALSDEDMAYFFSAYPGIRFGWTLRVGRWYVRTDAEAFSTLNSPDSDRCRSGHFEKLRYCYRLKALDLGHNSITDISFLEGLTELEVLILADNRIEDITPLRALRKLRYTELFMNRITDVSPLADNPLLLDVNLTYNRITDWTPLKTCPNIQRLWFGQNGLDKATRGEIEAFFSGAKVIYSSGSTGYGWREHPRYDVIYEIFHTGRFIPFDDPAEQ